MGFDSGGCLFWGHQREVMNYLVGGFCFGLNFWIVVPSGGKLWGNFGWAETVSQSGGDAISCPAEVNFSYWEGAATQ